MLFYSGIDPASESGRRIAGSLLTLRRALKKELPPKHVDRNLLLATWNIREFGGSKYGGHTTESIYYIAEIVSAFDLVAVQEVRDNVAPFHRVRALLGPWWKFLISDVTQGVRGNSERIGFLYDSRKVEFSGMASGIVFPPSRVSKSRGLEPAMQPARTPMLVSMKSGWLGFTMCATHSIWGAANANHPDRVAEIGALAQFLKKRVEDRFAWSPNMFLVGDLNIFNTTDETFRKLTEAGFIIPKAIIETPSNAKKDRHYDQIAFLSALLTKRTKSGAKGVQGGAFDFFRCVYRDKDEQLYASEMGSKYTQSTAKKKTTYFRAWRTFKMSDHLPLWISIDTDFSDGYLANKFRGRPSTTSTSDKARRRRST